MSEFTNNHLANLNHIEEYSTPQDDSATNHDLSLFANTNFFDFDIGRSIDLSVDEMLMQQEKTVQKHHQSVHPAASSSSSSNENIDLVSQYSLANDISTTTTTSTTPSPQTAAFNSFALHHAPPPPHIPTLQRQQPTLARAIVRPAAIEPATKKRKASSIVASSPTSSTADNSNANSPSDSKMSAEEDKRRRNTAASARFRMKKKQREQEMERHAKELQEKMQGLEHRVMELELENKWLRNLVVEKNEARDHTALLSMKKEILNDS